MFCHLLITAVIPITGVSTLQSLCRCCVALQKLYPMHSLSLSFWFRGLLCHGQESLPQHSFAKVVILNQRHLFPLSWVRKTVNELSPEPIYWVKWFILSCWFTQQLKGLCRDFSFPEGELHLYPQRTWQMSCCIQWDQLLSKAGKAYWILGSDNKELNDFGWHQAGSVKIEVSA